MPMIAEIVRFALPPGTRCADALALYRKSASHWLVNPDLVQKFYFFDAERGIGGGIYIWRSREAAARWHGDAYRAMVLSLYGSEPRIEILDALLHVDPVAGILAEL
jgi:hypothetical protein